MSRLDRPDVVEALTDLLGRCRIGSGATVAVLVRGDQRADLARDFEAAAWRCGASTFRVRLPDVELWPRDEPGPAVGTSLDAALPALLGADLVVDLFRLMWSPAQRRLLDAGVRVLACREPVSVLRRLYPTAERDARVAASAELLTAASTLRITNEAGSDLTYQLGPYRTLAQRGWCDEPGTWDHFASALVATCAADGAVDGTLVLDTGDVILPLGRYLESPVRLDIRGGRIEHVEGGADARLLSGYLASYDDPDAYAISHVGWGLAETAVWEALLTEPAASGVENRSAYGSVMVATGPNTEFGGANHSRCHLDIPMRRASLALDGIDVIRDGAFVPSSLAFAGVKG